MTVIQSAHLAHMSSYLERIPSGSGRRRLTDISALIYFSQLSKIDLYMVLVCFFWIFFSLPSEMNCALSGRRSDSSWRSGASVYSPLLPDPVLRLVFRRLCQPSTSLLVLVGLMNTLHDSMGHTVLVIQVFRM